MSKSMGQADLFFPQPLFLGLTGRCGIDWNDVFSLDMIDHQPASADIPLDKKKIAGLNRSVYPSENRSQERADGIRLRWYGPPEAADIFWRRNNSANTEFPSGCPVLGIGEYMVEQQVEVRHGFHLLFRTLACFSRGDRGRLPVSFFYYGQR